MKQKMLVLFMVAAALIGFQATVIDDHVWFRMRTSAPANPSAGFGAVFINSTTGLLGCILPGGTSCMPSGGGTNYQTVQVAGTGQTQRPTLNFVSGVTCSDNAGSTRTDCTVTGGGAPDLRGPYGSIPGCGSTAVNGQRYIPESGSLMDYYWCDTSGTPTWRGVVDRQTIPAWDQTGWSWVNQSNAGLDIDQANSNPVKGTLMWSGVSSSNTLHAILTTAPANNTTWAIQARLGFLGIANGQAGIILRTSGTDQSWVCSIFADDGSTNVRFRCVGYDNTAMSNFQFQTGSTPNNFHGDWLDVCLTNNSTSNNIETYTRTKGGVWRASDDPRGKTTMGTINQYGLYTTGGAKGVELQVYGWKPVSGTCGAW